MSLSSILRANYLITLSLSLYEDPERARLVFRKEKQTRERIEAFSVSFVFCVRFIRTDRETLYI